MEVTLDYYLIFAIVVLIALAVLLYRELTNQKMHYKKIIDNSKCIVIIANRSNILEVNKTFFTYFSTFSNIVDFIKKHKSLGSFFEDEEGCLKIYQDESTWIEYLATHQDTQHKVKMHIEDEIYYFLASASTIDAKKGIFAITFLNVSDQHRDKKALELLTLNDSLTNIGNRRLFIQKLQEYLVLAQRYNTSFSVLVIDIDSFKNINNKYGNETGDKILIDFATLVRKNIRVGDIFTRITGEKFAILLPLITKDKAYLLAQKLRIMVEEFQGVTPLTISGGLVQYEKSDDEQSILKRADSLLYKAKESGKNRVIVG